MPAKQLARIKCVWIETTALRQTTTEREIMDKKILVVIDAQNDFITGALGTPEARAIVPKIIEKIRNFEGPIISTYDTHDDNYLETQEGGLLPVIHCQRHSLGWALEPNIFEALWSNDDYYFSVNKSGFGSRQLIEKITDVASWETNEIVVIGLTTGICVITNVLLLKTFFPEPTITVDASCCAGTTPENHAAALQVMRSCQVNVING